MAKRRPLQVNFAGLYAVMTAAFVGLCLLGSALPWPDLLAVALSGGLACAGAVLALCR